MYLVEEARQSERASERARGLKDIFFSARAFLRIIIDREFRKRERIDHSDDRC
jgi:hypothetical protein